jgi:hypothetical protein
MSCDDVKRVAQAVGGTVDWAVTMPDGTGAATISYPLPDDDWLRRDGFDEPPMPFRVGTEERVAIELSREEFAAKIREAARYAIRASTDNGRVEDYDPDAMVQNFIVGLLGYWTSDGRSHL